MARRKPFISDKLWEMIAPLLPTGKPTAKGGRPPRDSRECLEGILWILKTGAPWVDLPQRYPSPSTCWRRLVAWEEDGTWLKIWQVFLGALDERGKIDWEEFFVDGSFSPAKKGGFASDRPRRAREQNGWLPRMEKAYQSLCTLSRRLEQKSNSSNRRSRKCAFPKRDQEDREPNQEE